MFLLEFLPAREHKMWAYCRQMGIKHCVVKADPSLTGLPPPWESGVLKQLQTNFLNAGINLYGLEGDPFNMSRIKLGLPGRDEDIERYQRMVQIMGSLGIKLLCYNFLAGVQVVRTSFEVPIRGGALTSAFSHANLDSNATNGISISSEEVWDNYCYFLKAVVPVAEASGVVLGAHPDDPPLPSLHKIGRILYSPAQFEKALRVINSHSHGLTFCQANWKLMGRGKDEAEANEALYSNITEFTRTGRVHFLHVRDVRGTASDFHETFHDEGPTDLGKCLRLYHEAGYRGPLRSDHVPLFDGEVEPVPGVHYGILGRLFANGYILGLLDSQGIRNDPS